VLGVGVRVSLGCISGLKLLHNQTPPHHQKKQTTKIKKTQKKNHPRFGGGGGVVIFGVPPAKTLKSVFGGGPFFVGGCGVGCGVVCGAFLRGVVVPWRGGG